MAAAGRAEWFYIDMLTIRYEDAIIYTDFTNSFRT